MDTMSGASANIVLLVDVLTHHGIHDGVYCAVLVIFIECMLSPEESFVKNLVNEAETNAEEKSLCWALVVHCQQHWFLLH